MGKLIRCFTNDESGSAAAGYGLIAAVLCIAIVTILQGVGMRLTAPSSLR